MTASLVYLGRSTWKIRLIRFADGARLSSNHLIRPRQHIRWDRQADLLGGFEVDDELELRRLLDRQIGRASCRERVYHPV